GKARNRPILIVGLNAPQSTQRLRKHQQNNELRGAGHGTALAFRACRMVKRLGAGRSCHATPTRDAGDPTARRNSRKSLQQGAFMKRLLKFFAAAAIPLLAANFAYAEGIQNSK